MGAQEYSLVDAIKKKFVTLPGENLTFIQRKHWSVFAFPIFMLFIMALFFMGLLTFAFRYFSSYTPQLILLSALIVLFFLSLALRSIIDWYFNMYVVTNRKMIEVSYSPLAAHKINQVLLDQVRCTEIDTQIEGIVNDFLDIGNVIITFDRPTHQEEFIFESVKDPRDIEKYLQETMCQEVSQRNYSASIQPVIPQPKIVGIYNRDLKSDSNKWTYTEIVDNTLEDGVVWNI